MELFYRKSGEGSPIIILHGLFGCCDNWVTVCKEFAKTNTVYAIDQRNHGQSPQSADWSYNYMADDLYEFLNTHQIKNPILIGHSMGGKTVMKFAAKYPQVQISKQIVVDISPKYYPPHHQQILDALYSVPLSELKTRNEADQFMSDSIAEFDIRQFLMKNLYRNTEGNFQWRMNLDIIANKIEEIGQKSDENSISMTETLFIKGAYSDYIKGGDEILIKKIFSNSKIQIIEAGHWVQAENPVAFIKAIYNFI